MCPNCLDKERELAKLKRKLWIIQEVSRIKNELKNLDPNENFRRTVVNPNYRKELEEIFGVKFYNVKKRYLSLLNERNHICHSYSPFQHKPDMPSYW